MKTIRIIRLEKWPGSLLLIMLLTFSAGLFSQTDTILSETKHMSGYKYKELNNYNGCNHSSLPLVIALPWMGSSPDYFYKYMIGFDQPVRVILVEAPYPFGKGFSFFQVEPENYYEQSSERKAEVLIEESDKLSQFIHAATEHYKPPKVPVIIGASQGGDLSYMTAIRHGTLVGLSCPLLGTIGSELFTPKETKDNCPVVAFHGTADSIVNINVARDHIKHLKEKGYNAKLNEYEGYGHQIPEEMQKDYIRLISEYFWDR